jgi:hypothetical protein
MSYGAVFIQGSEILKVEQGPAFRIAKRGVCNRRSRPLLREVHLALDVLVLFCSTKDNVAGRDPHFYGSMRGKFRLVMQDLAVLLQNLQINYELTRTLHDEAAAVLARGDHACGINSLRIKTTADGNP